MHRHKIDQIQEMRSRSLVLSLCNEFKLMIWGFENEKFKLYRQYNTQRPLQCLKIFGENVLFNFKQGE